MERSLEYSPQSVGGGMYGGGAGVLALLALIIAAGKNGGLLGGSDGDSNAQQTIGLMNNMTANANQVDSQFTATNANINANGRDTAIGFAGVSKGLCELGSKIDNSTLTIVQNDDKNTQTILTQMSNDREQALRDQLAAVTLKSEFANRGILEANGPAMAVIPNKCNDGNEGLQLQINSIRNDINAIGSNIANLSNALAGQVGK